MLKGRNVLLKYKDGSTYKAFAASRDCKLNISTNTTETASTNGNWKTFISRKNEWTVTTSGLIGTSDNSSFIKKLITCSTNKTELEISFIIGDTQVSGKCIIDKLAVDGTYNRVSTYSATLKGNGQLT